MQESRHQLARKICHGNGGKIRQAYREGWPGCAILSFWPFLRWTRGWLRRCIQGGTSRSSGVSRQLPAGPRPFGLGTGAVSGCLVWGYGCPRRGVWPR
ncbi:transposase [Nonomuraea mesophila]|uniref:transposase n=1 Tax=Nonomuraea mesophila TaxID=2530382 RepID=UPI001C708C7D